MRVSSLHQKKKKKAILTIHGIVACGFVVMNWLTANEVLLISLNELSWQLHIDAPCAHGVHTSPLPNPARGGLLHTFKHRNCGGHPDHFSTCGGEYPDHSFNTNDKWRTKALAGQPAPDPLGSHMCIFVVQTDLVVQISQHEITERMATARMASLTFTDHSDHFFILKNRSM